ncbi:MAG: AMP-binding protein [Pseudomonadota bacterium]
MGLLKVYTRRLLNILRNEVLVLPSRVALLVGVLFLLALPLITQDYYFLRVMILTAIFAILAASWDLLSGFTGQMNFGHALFFGVSAYVTALLNIDLGFPPILSIPLGAVGGVVAGLVVGIPCLRLRGSYLALTTLAFPIILMGLVFAMPGLTGGELGLSGLSRLSGSRTTDYYLITGVMLLCCLVMWKITESNTGIILHAIREDELAARAAGINTTRYKLLAFCLSGFFAGIAGGLYAHFMRLAGPSTLEVSLSFQVIIWAVFGGMVSIYGPVVGVFLLNPLMEVLRGVQESFPALPEMRMFVFAGLVLVTLLFMPEGLVPWLKDLLETECPRCKVRNARSRGRCRVCDASLQGQVQSSAPEETSEQPTAQAQEPSYLAKPWLAFYPPGVPEFMDIPTGSVPQLFDQAAEKFGGQSALIFYGTKISYQELKDLAERFAAGLVGLGIKKGDRVALLLLNCPQYVIAYLGALKAGAVVTPVSPVYTSQEVAHQLKDSGARVVVCQDILYDNVEKTGLALDKVIITAVDEYLPAIKKMVANKLLQKAYGGLSVPDAAKMAQAGLLGFQDLIKQNQPLAVPVSIDPQMDLAALPYTGGTTGHPKAAMITHRNIVACQKQALAFWEHKFKDGQETVIAFLPLFHIYGQVVIMLTGLMRGHTLVLFTTPEMDEILAAMERYDASAFYGVPTLYEHLKEYEKTDRVDWKRVKVLVCGADTLQQTTVEGWERRTKSHITQGYGMTETAAVTHTNPLDRPKKGSFGLPIPNIDAAVVDVETLEFMPVGQVGELLVSGPNVMQGYWQRPKDNLETMIQLHGRTWLRTGDLVSMDQEGYFHFFDRKRDLIKHRGYSVFAKHVEEVLYSHPQVKAAGVVGVPDPKVGQLIKAYVVCQAEARGKLSEEELMCYCREKLAHYKVPQIIEFRGELPKTDVGKVSRRELREQTEEA